MRRYILCLLTGCVALTLSPSPSPCAVEPVPPQAPPPKVKSLDWKKDPVCQMIFFAVLEGLYADGVTDDVVEAVVSQQGKSVADPLARLREMYTKRDALYRQASHFVIETGRPSIPALVNTVLMQLELAGLLNLSRAPSPIDGTAE